MARILGVWLVSLCCFVAPVFAVDIVVDQFDDGADPIPGDGVCDDGAGGCTLRAAIQTANALAGPDNVILPPGTRSLTSKRDPDVADELTGDLDVTSDITVVGIGGNEPPCAAGACIDGKGGKDRIFDVSGNGALALENLILRNGKASKTDPDPGQVDEVSGGCVRVAGTFSSTQVAIEGCSSPDDGGCVGVVDGAFGSFAETFLTGCKAKDAGGGIEVDAAAIDLIMVTISDSKAGDEGGGIEVSDSEASLRNVTLSGNKAKRGGGLIAEGTAVVFANSSTFAGNSASDGASILGAADDPVLIQNSILASKKGNDCSGSGDSLGNNIDAGTSCFLSGPGDQSNVDPLLGELADNGGEVPTHELLAGSPAVDRGDDASCEVTDARGEARLDLDGIGTADTECDVGAFELVPAM